MFVIFICICCLLLNLFIQLFFIGASMGVMVRKGDLAQSRLFHNVVRLGVMVTLLFVGHMLQISVWAYLFSRVGEFESFKEAFYHSTVNYSSLGYGDIVMTSEWRLAGALEASVGVMMFGVSTATLFAAMTRIFQVRFGKD